MASEAPRWDPLDVPYRLLGLLVGLRRLLVALGLLGGAGLWLWQVHEATAEPTPPRLLSLLVMPTVLGLAIWWLAALPPGVVFRPAPPGGPVAPRRTARCLASGYFERPDGPEWRLLARSSLAVARDGSLRLVSPPPLLAGPDAARQAFPSRGRLTRAELAAARRLPFAEWVYQPEALGGSAARVLYQSADEYMATVGTLVIPRAALVAVAAGWQYAGGRRWAAIQLLYRDELDQLTAAYLAFPDPGQQAWVLEHLPRRAP
ncbi:MAG TPA: hypothetical protein VFB73_04505 [Chloroflexota bacterium]|nr:hypothetical protein [Chloroflexota bacterium]